MLLLLLLRRRRRLLQKKNDQKIYIQLENQFPRRRRSFQRGVEEVPLGSIKALIRHY